MNNIVTNNFKRYSNYPSGVAKQTSNEAKKKRTSFYDDYLEKSNPNKQATGFAINSHALKLPDLTPQKTLSVLQNSETTGRAIKKNIESVLSKKYGELDTRHIFDDIDDKDIEDNIETAENTIKTNIDRGMLSKTTLPKLPNLRDGLALSYAAANKGKSKAATRAREAAYTESVEPLVKKTQTSMLSRELPKTQSSIPKTTVQTPSTAKLMGNVGEEPKTKNLVWNPNEKLSAEKLIYNGKNPYFTDNIQKLSATSESTAGIRFKDMVEKQATDNKENRFDYSDKKSSTLDKYELSDAAKDWILPTDGVWDVFGNIKEKDYISATTDVARWKNPTAEIAKDAARALWKTGSEFYLRPKGLDISADMLEHSLQEKPKDVVFYEDSDVVKQIKNNSEFITHLDEVVYKKENNIPLTEEDKQHNFEASDNQDLYYSIHGCHFDIDNISYNEDGTRDISVHISDNYDYTKIWTSMDGKEFSPLRISLGTIANDMGTITSKIDAINPYKVDIYFTIRR